MGLELCAGPVSCLWQCLCDGQPMLCTKLGMHAQERDRASLMSVAMPL